MRKIDSELAEFCVDNQRRLLRLMAAYTGDATVAEELVQETLVRVCRDWVKVRAMSDPDEWATKVAFNLARSWYRRLYAGRRARERLAASEIAAHEPDRAAGLVVLAALEGLPDRQRQVVVLRFLDDRSVAETADVMGCSPGTVRAHTSRAIAALRGMNLGFELPGDTGEPATDVARTGADR